jgi:hypothetical protein
MLLTFAKPLITIIMKNFVLLAFMLLMCKTSFCQKKKEILSEINGYYKTKVQNIAYDKPEKEIWNALYSIVIEKYPEIVRESESKLFIEARKEAGLKRTTALAEIRGEKSFRVVFSITTEVKLLTSVNPVVFSDWTRDTTTDPSLVLNLQVRLCEMLNGPIELSPDLLSRVETYNNSQKKEKSRIIKGRDY